MGKEDIQNFEDFAWPHKKCEYFLTFHFCKCFAKQRKRMPSFCIVYFPTLHFCKCLPKKKKFHNFALRIFLLSTFANICYEKVLKQPKYSLGDIKRTARVKDSKD